MEKVKVVIVEDEFPIAEDIRLVLEQNSYEVLSVFNRAETALPFIIQQIPDIVLVDIRLLGKTDGINMVVESQKTLKLPIIYITANSDKVMYERAKKTNPHAFLIKPFTAANLLAAVDLALYNFSLQHYEAIENHEAGPPFLMNKCLFVKAQGKYKKIHFENVLFIEASGSYVHIQTLSERFTLSQNLSQFQKKTPLSDFIRIHRSYAVNLNRIDSFEDSCVFIQSYKLPLSDQYKAEFLKRIHCL